MVHQEPEIVILRVGGETIETTPKHLIYTEERMWVYAGYLHAGEHVRRADGTSGSVEAVILVVRTQFMYDLTVAKAHTFFVGDGQWLVHNCGDIDVSDLGPNALNKDGRIVGANGTQADGSQTYWTKDKYQLHAENFDPGTRPGNIHLQDIDKDIKWSWKFTEGRFAKLPKDLVKIIKGDYPQFKTGLNNALDFLGEANVKGPY